MDHFLADLMGQLWGMYEAVLMADLKAHEMARYWAAKSVDRWEIGLAVLKGVHMVVELDKLMAQ